MDLFANMAVSDGGDATGQQQLETQQHPPEQKKMSTADIMSMFNNPSTQHNPMQQNMFAMSGGMTNGIGGGMGGNNMAMMGQQMGGGMNPNNMVRTGMPPQQQQMAMLNNMKMMQRSQMMGQQGRGNIGGSMDGMGMMGGQGMGSMGGNGMMMQQQGHMPQMYGMMASNSNMMMTQGGGGMMQGRDQYGQSPMGEKAQPSPQKQQQFAEFGNFGR